MSETNQSSSPTEILPEDAVGGWSVWLKRLMPLWGFFLFGVALWLLHRELSEYHIDDISDALFSINSSTIIRTLILTVFGYSVLAYYDVLALRTMKKNLKLGQMMLASFTGFAVSNSTGHALIAGGSLRYRFYSNWGVGALDVAKISLYSTFTYFLGVAVLWLSTAFFTVPNSSIIPTLPVTLVALLILGVYLGWIYSGRSIRLKDFELTPPEMKLGLMQILLGTLDALLTVMVLYLLVNAYAEVSWIELVRAYLLAQLAGLFSQVPGGIGVFEGSFMALMPNTIEGHQLISALVLFRIIYYIVPLLAAGMGLVLYEARQSRLMHRRVTRQTLSVVRASIPRIYALLMILASIVLLVSGVTPADEDRLDWLLDLLPLPIMEFSHLIGSVVGLLALFVARAVFLRIDSAYYAAVAMLIAGIIASLLKGFDYEEAIALTVMLFLFLPTKKFFYRKSALLQLHFPAAWWLLILLVVVGATWLGFFSYRHVEYADELWWQISWEGDASRFLRSTLGMAVVGLSFLAYRIIVKPHENTQLPTEEELLLAEKVAVSSGTTHGLVALSGDKFLLWSESKQAFLMYQRTPRFWIALGDPIGKAEEFDQLIWQFRTLADQHSAEVAFYEVGVQFLPSYIDLGMTLLKLGEEGRVDLNHFSLQGKKQANLRNAINKMQREGFSFEVLPKGQDEQLLASLKGISDEWMENKKAREKGFSLGFFDEHYLAKTPIAVVRKDDRIFAFANVWHTENFHELSIDLMRYRDESPNGIMEFLMVSLMQWGKENGYRWFNLGMAPLSGLEDHPLAPVWHKVGNTLFSYGNEFYNFEGLLQYKRKFNPDWQARYLAVPSGVKAPQVLMTVTLLIAGGIRGVFGK